LIVITLIMVVLFTTELFSNVALINIAAPVVAGIAIGLGVPMLHVLIPITIASSCAYCIGIGLLIVFYKYLIPLVF